MSVFEIKTVTAGRQRDLRAKVRELRKQGWERFDVETSVVETGPGYRKATYQQCMRRPASEGVA